MSRYERTKLFLWGMITALLLGHVWSPGFTTAQAQQGGIVGRYQIVAAGRLPNGVAQAYIIDTETGEFRLTQLGGGRFDRLEE